MNPGNRPGAWMQPAEEAALVQGAGRGNRTAFFTLLRYYDASVYRIIFALVRNAESAQALTRETFLRAWKGVGKIPEGQQFYPWLTRIARGLAVTQVRRSAPAPASGAALGLTRNPAEAGVRDPLRVRACEQAFAELGIDHQVILVLRVVEKLSYADIARTLDIPLGATLSRLATARAAIAKRLEGPQENAA